MSTPRFPRTLELRLREIERRTGYLERATPSTPGYQLIGTTAYFGSGLQVGSARIGVTEVRDVPQPTGLTLSWGSSFDSIYIDVAWTPPAGVMGADQIAGYVVQLQKAAPGSIPIETTVGSDETSTRFQPVEPNSTYAVVVYAKSKLAGRLSDPVPYGITVGGDTSVPAAPTGLAVTTGIGSLAIKWNANTEPDVANGAGWYRVIVSPNANLSSPVYDGKINGTFAFPTGLALVPYYVALYAVDSSGNQSPRATVPSGSPWTPRAIAGSDVGTGQITGTNVAVDTLTANNIAAAAIGTSELAANSVIVGKIAANAVTATTIASGQISTDKLVANLSLIVGQVIQSSNFVGGSTGWRIAADGSAEFSNVAIRGSSWVGGSINIAGRIVASPTDPSIHLSANVEIGANYSGTVYSGDANWGLQVGSLSPSVWTHVQGYLDTTNKDIGFFDVSRNQKVLYVSGNAKNCYYPGPDGVFYAEKRSQDGGWETKGIVVQNGGVLAGSNGDHAGISFNVPERGVASILQVVGSVGDAIEARNSTNTGFVALKASGFLVNSQQRTKRGITALDPATVDRFAQLKPVRYQRPAAPCAICQNTGKAQVEIPHPFATDAHERVETPRMLKVGQRCPVCQGSKKNPARTEARKRYEDSEFFGLVVEDVAEVYPEAVSWTTEGDRVVPEAIDYAALYAVALAKLQELTARVTELEAHAHS